MSASPFSRAPQVIGGIALLILAGGCSTTRHAETPEVLGAVHRARGRPVASCHFAEGRQATGKSYGEEAESKRAQHGVEHD
jgi:hypothetical protein